MRMQELLETVGFADVKVHKAVNKPWIAVIGRKPTGREVG